MGWFHESLRKLSHLVRRQRFDEAMEEEIRLHLEERAEELAAGGMTRKEALLAARREFGPTSRISEESREAWQMRWLEDLRGDLRYAARTLGRDRGFAITAVLSLALGIGVNTTMFSLTAEFLFSQPSVRDAGKLMRVEMGPASRSTMREYKFLRDAGVFDGITGANEMQEINWRSGDVSERLFVTRVTGEFFEVTGIPVEQGRPIAHEERFTAVVSHRFWRAKLNGDRAVLGRTLVLDGQPYTITGVLPAGHRSLMGFGYVPDLYIPVASETATVGMYARLRPGMTTEQGLARLKAVCLEMDRVFPDGNQRSLNEVTLTKLAGIERLTWGFLKTVSSFFAMLMGAACLLLLIACANVASLLLARASTRVQEFAIRMSVGAGRGRVMRQMLAESLLLSLLGVAAGLALNYVLTRMLNRIVVPGPFPMRLAIEPDWRLAGYAAVVAVLCAVAAGLLPALQSAKAGTSHLLKGAEHQVAGRGMTLRNGLIGAQLAVSVLVLIIAVLSVRNLMRSTQLDPGFDTRHTLWVQMRLVPDSYPNAVKVRAAVSSALERMEQLPGVDSASVAVVVPLNDHFLSRSTMMYTDAAPQGMRTEHAWNGVGPGYFRTMGIEMIAGREFTAMDREGAPRPVIVNEALAWRVFGTKDAVGRRIRLGEERTARVVAGVARNSKYSTIGERDRPALYESYFQVGGRSTVQLLVKALAVPEPLIKPLGAELLRLDPASSVEVKPMSRALAFALMPSQMGAVLLGTMGVLGLALAAVGLFGVLTYAVTRRTREIGLRVALGAQRRDIVRLVIVEGAWFVGGGLLLGGLVARFVTKPLATFLVPGLQASDPVSYAVVTAVLIAVGAAASLRPALRALRMDPMTALRYE